MLDIYQWAVKWGVPVEGIEELRRGLGAIGIPPSVGCDSERGNQARIRLSAAEQGDVLWRNNVGAYVDDSGRQVRYGLANESKRINQRVKSSDLIGIHRVVITPEMVGTVFGQFMAIEVKKPTWTPGDDPKREDAQQRFMDIVIAHGGVATFMR